MVQLNNIIDIKIRTESWDHTCGDGCCYTYGTDVYINGEKVSQGDFSNIETILEDVLTHLKFNVKWEEG